MRAQELVADGLLPLADACEWLGISRSTLYVLMERGEIPYTMVAPRKRAIPRRALAIYAARNLVGRLAGEEITQEVGTNDVA